MNVLFVCLGNICRSPTAEAVLRAGLRRAGRDDVTVASCGISTAHTGEPADARTLAHARTRGFELGAHRARTVFKSDFARFDLIYAMDDSNLRNLRALCPPEHQHKLALFLEAVGVPGVRVVPDPWAGGPEGFEHVLDLLEDACARWLQLH